MTLATEPTTATTPSVPGALSDPPSERRGAVVSEPTHPIPELVDPLLLTILTWPRAHKSTCELGFCTTLRSYLVDTLKVKMEVKSEGCIVATVPRPAAEGKPDPKDSGFSTTLFSCHVDTIDPHDLKLLEGATPDDVAYPRKKLTYDPNFGLIGLDKDSIGSSLGADDGAGVWLMLKMIERKVPGTYVFHRGEEVGGVGSRAMADKDRDFLAQFECAVAFDRADTFEVITHQRSSRCASDKFADALCARLNSKGMKYEKSSRGVFTDTANYRSIIPECVNIGVGYESQHGRNESLDYAHLSALLEVLCAIDWDSLPIDRDPKKYEPSGGYGGYAGGYNGRSYAEWDDEWGASWMNKPVGGSNVSTPNFDKSSRKKNKKNKQAQHTPHVPQLDLFEELSGSAYTDLLDWVELNPEEAAEAIGKLCLEIGRLRSDTAIIWNLLGWKDEK